MSDQRPKTASSDAADLLGFDLMKLSNAGIGVVYANDVVRARECVRRALQNARAMGRMVPGARSIEIDLEAALRLLPGGE